MAKRNSRRTLRKKQRRHEVRLATLARPIVESEKNAPVSTLSIKEKDPRSQSDPSNEAQQQRTETSRSWIPKFVMTLAALGVSAFINHISGSPLIWYAIAGVFCPAVIWWSWGRGNCSGLAGFRRAFSFCLRAVSSGGWNGLQPLRAFVYHCKSETPRAASSLLQILPWGKCSDEISETRAIRCSKSTQGIASSFRCSRTNRMRFSALPSAMLPRTS